MLAILKEDDLRTHMILRSPINFANIEVKCGLCNRSARMNQLSPEIIIGLLIVLENPRKYLFECETLSCGWCFMTTFPGTSCYPFYDIYELNYAEPVLVLSHFVKKMMFLSSWTMVIYNTLHKYYMALEKRQGIRTGFQIRATDPRKYDPYRVRYITLFDILSATLSDN